MTLLISVVVQIELAQSTENNLNFTQTQPNFQTTMQVTEELYTMFMLCVGLTLPRRSYWLVCTAHYLIIVIV